MTNPSRPPFFKGRDHVNVAVCYVTPELKNRAEQLAQKLDLACISFSEKNDYAGLLLLTPHRLEFSLTAENDLNSIYVDFLSGKANYRHQKADRRQLLARAVGLHKKKNRTICDISAGLGKDAFVLAGLGAKVTMIERSAIIGALLEDGLERAKQNDQIRALSWTFVLADSKHYLSTLPEDQRPEVIYLDPMFPERKKSALVKKEMRILRLIAGEDTDAPELLALALKTATERVVVKRPRLAEPIAGLTADFKLEGQSSRFDVYLLYGKR